MFTAFTYGMKFKYEDIDNAQYIQEVKEHMRQKSAGKPINDDDTQMQINIQPKIEILGL